MPTEAPSRPRPPSPSALSSTQIAISMQAPKQTTGVLSPAQLNAIQQQRLEMRRRLSFSDVVRGTFGARHVKLFLYAWSIVVILMGLGLLGLGLYLLYFQENVHIAPTFAYYVATFTGLALALLSGLGLAGLQQQRKCVTEGKRNYALGTFIFLSAVGAAIMIMGGIVALTLLGVVRHAATNDFALEHVRVFETAVITNLRAYVLRDRSGWRGIQQTLSCCGYTSPHELVASSSLPWDRSLLAMLSEVNAVAGKYCAKTASECASSVGFPCPSRGRAWCRHEFYALMRENYKLIGIFALVVGIAQLVSSAFALFTLLCDVRMLPTRSPVVEMPRQPLAPVLPVAATPTTTSAGAARVSSDRSKRRK